MKAQRYKFFPFAPGIAWKLKRNKYIIPEVDGNTWGRVLENKEFIITCFGGLLESFFALSYCEAIARVEPQRVIKYATYKDFNILPIINALSNNIELNPDLVQKYPTPIFMDKNNNAYFNVLNNYLIQKPYYPINQKYPPQYNKEICLKQIYQNCMLRWDNYVPKIRNLNRVKYNSWKKSHNLSGKYVVIFPGRYKTMHDLKCLDWNDRQIRELAEMLSSFGIKVVCCQDNIDLYNTPNLIRVNMDLDIVFCLLQEAYGVLSKDIDFLLISLCISDCIVISENVGDIYDLYMNAEYVQADNMICTEDDLKPISVYKILEGLRNV